MNIEVKMFMTFKQYLPAGSADGKTMLSLRDGATFTELMDSLGIPHDKPKLVIINGISKGITDAAYDERLNDGDIVSIFPPALGG